MKKKEREEWDRKSHEKHEKWQARVSKIKKKHTEVFMDTEKGGTYL